MVAVILAGGQGTRLRPHTNQIPKPLLPVMGRPIIEIILKQMQNTGVTQVFMAVNHLSEQIINTLGDGREYGLKIGYSHENKPLGTIGPLKLIKNLPENFFVANSDVLTDLNFKSLFEAHLKSRAKMTVATHSRMIPIEFGVLNVNGQGRASGFKEKPQLKLTVSMGIYVFHKSILDFVPVNKSFGFDELMFLLLEKEIAVHTYAYNGYWLDVGRPDDYQKANDDAERFRE